MRDKSGQLITEDSQKRSRWNEHFEEILNRPEPENPIGQPNTDEILERVNVKTDYISAGEIRRAMSDMKNRKAPGRYGITVELLKADSIITKSILEELFRVIWTQRKYRAVGQKGLL